MKTLVGLFTVLIGLISYGLYIRDIFRGQTKPHAISWLIWSLSSGVIFFAQQGAGAGAGSWIVGLTSVAAFLIFGLAIRRGHPKVTRLDWFCLAATVIAIAIFVMNDNHIAAVIIASTTFVLGMAPTLMKSYTYPYQETVTTFFLNGLKFLIAVPALGSLAFINIFYPITLTVANWILVTVILLRRATCPRPKH